MLRILIFLIMLKHCRSGTLKIRETHCECGIKNDVQKHLEMGENMVIEFAGNHAWPWMSAIVNISISDDPVAYCGGSLINDQYIVTAAHCISDMETTGLTNFRIYLGTNFIKNENGDDFLDLGISEIKTHPKFDFDTADYDIAIIKLNDIVTYTKNIRPVCLKQPSLDSLIGKNAILSGWGSINLTSSTQDELKEQDSVIVQINDCAKNYSTVEIPITKTMLCASELLGQDPCKADSGGPLVLSTSRNRFTQIGIISHGQGCHAPDFPTIFSRMSVFIDWIAENTKDALYCRGTF